MGSTGEATDNLELKMPKKAGFVVQLHQSLEVFSEIIFQGFSFREMAVTCQTIPESGKVIRRAPFSRKFTYVSQLLRTFTLSICLLFKFELSTEFSIMYFRVQDS